MLPVIINLNDAVSVNVLPNVFFLTAVIVVFVVYGYVAY